MANGDGSTSLIPNFDDITGPSTTQKASEQASSKKKNLPAQYWLNVGIERNGRLCSLPMGIPLDNLKPKPIPAAGHTADATPDQIQKKAEFRAMRDTEHKLWGKLQEVYLGLKPGEEKTVQLVCRVRRVDSKELTETEQETNPFALGDDFKL